jgi:putative endonuclease
MTNRPNGTLYLGTTTDIARRAWEHREGVADGFTKKYGLKRLVYAEWHVGHGGQRDCSFRRSATNR